MSLAIDQETHAEVTRQLAQSEADAEQATKTISEMAADRRKLLAEIDRLRSALKPFAEEASWISTIEKDWPDDMPLLTGGKVTKAHYASAQAEYEQSHGDK
jgi:seryl-tRNA synthetase